jgi:hypothetical protein
MYIDGKHVCSGLTAKRTRWTGLAAGLEKLKANPGQHFSEGPKNIHGKFQRWNQLFIFFGG